MKTSLLIFRTVAYIVGVLLLLLAFIAMPLKYLANEPALVEVVAPAHGLLYMGYVAICIELARRAGWGLRRTALIALAGTVPVFTFAAERAVTKELSPDRRAT